ncbi:MAG: DUF937 domain-containing protein [Hyphomicrobiaceae bacterium]|nr:DUF937 domain-containing protein [Hyphomicrobiaceae bacterium]
MTAHTVERLRKELTPQLQGYLAKTSGESPAATAKAAETAVTTLFSGIAAAAATPTGLAALSRLVNDPVNDGALLNQLPALYQGTMTASPVYRLGSQMLHQVFGSKLGTVNQSIATLAGVKPSAAATMTSTIAPHVLAVIGQDQRADGDTSAASLARLLGVTSPADAVARLATAVAAAAGSVAASATAAAAKTASSTAAKSDMTRSQTRDEDARSGKAIGTTDASGAATASANAPANPRRAGGGAWLIFPAGFTLGAGLLGVGSLISDQVRQWPEGGQGSRGAVIATATPPAAPVMPAPKPAAAVPAAPAVPVATPAPAPAAAAVARAPEPELKPGPPGTTSFFGSTPSAGSKPAVMNPDYRPAQVAPPVAATPPIVVPESVPRLSPPGTTTYFGSAPTPPDKPVVINPDYKPAPPPVVANPAPVPPPAPAPKPVAAAPPPPAPVPPAPSGTTTYFGTGSGAPALPPVTIDPSYKFPEPKNSPRAVAQAPTPTLDLGGCRLAVMAVTGQVRFETASASLAKSSNAMLDRIATAFTTCAAGKLKIDGHTDDRGSAEYNLTLSEARARSVANYLAARGIDRSRLAWEGFGFAKPLVPNTSAENMAKNRRIDFSVE